MTARALQVEHIFIILIAAGQPAFFLPFFCLLCYLLCCLCFALILPSSNRSDLPCFCLYLFHLPFRLPLFCLIFKYCWPPSVYWKSLITLKPKPQLPPACKVPMVSGFDRGSFNFRFLVCFFLFRDPLNQGLIFQRLCWALLSCETRPGSG